MYSKSHLAFTSIIVFTFLMVGTPHLSSMTQYSYLKHLFGPKCQPWCQGLITEKTLENLHLSSNEHGPVLFHALLQWWCHCHHAGQALCFNYGQWRKRGPVLQLIRAKAGLDSEAHGSYLQSHMVSEPQQTHNTMMAMSVKVCRYSHPLAHLAIQLPS